MHFSRYEVTVAQFRVMRWRPVSHTQHLGVVLTQGSHQHPRLRIFLYHLLVSLVMADTQSPKVSLPKVLVLIVLQSVLQRQLLNLVIVINLLLDLGE